MISKNKIIWLAAAIIIIGGIAYAGIGIFEYVQFKRDFAKAAEAAGGCPWQDGGTITIVRMPCILDFPLSPLVPTHCTYSCPMVTSIWQTACAGYIEIDTQGQLGTTFIAAPIGFKYSGGGTFPKAGDQFLACGASNAIPWVIGIPGASASRIQKLVNAFKFIIAGKR